MPASRPVCPVDGSPLEPHAHGTVAFHGCRRCHGLWFTAAEMDRARTGPVVADPFSDRPLPGADPTAAFRVRPCPGCGGAMQTRGVEGVEVDGCPACRSLWLDAGELDTVLAWQRLRDRSVIEPASVAAGAAATAVLASQNEPQRQQLANSALDAADGVLEVAEGVVDIAEVVVDVAAVRPWATLEMAGELAGFLGEVVSGGAEVALEVAGGVLSLVGGLLDGF